MAGLNDLVNSLLLNRWCIPMLANRFAILGQIGAGTYGKAHAALDRHTYQVVCVKCIDTINPRAALREAAILWHIPPHPNIITLYHVTIEPTRVCLIFPLMRIDLGKKMRRQYLPLSPMTVRSYIRQLLQAVEHCHAHGFLHLDIKPGNILLDGLGTLQLADFGSARQIWPMPDDGCCTLWYRPPEILLGSTEWTPACDIWSVGCVLGEMLFHEPIFPGNNQIETLFRIFGVLGTPSEYTWVGVTQLPHFSLSFPRYPLRPMPSIEPIARDLLHRLLVYDPLQRISASEALGHQYFI